MKITLAGANLDRRLWKEGEGATPEVMAAAYARVSHSPKSLSDLREDASADVERARRSNDNIVYRMGHSSIAEHAVFNLDIEEASRLLVEFIEHHRLASFTERSQRYVSFDHKRPTVPGELKGTDLGKELAELDSRKFDLYGRLISDEDLKTHYGDGLLEEARYVLGMTCPTDVGMTANAREIETMISKGLAHPLSEVRDFSGKLLEETGELAPSLIKYIEPDKYRYEADFEIKKKVDELARGKIMEMAREEPGHIDQFRRDVCEGTPSPCDDPESEIVAALIFQNSNLSFTDSRCLARELTDEELMDFLLPVFSSYPLHSSLPRAFEMMDLTFDFSLSASAFAQLKRHRMATLITQGYQPGEWLTPSLMMDHPNLTKEYWDIMERSRDLHRLIKEEHGPNVAAYALSNGHKRRVIFKLNLRELYHFVRLRSDSHAQSEIREISDKIVDDMREHYPIVTALLCGKDSHSETKQRVLGCEK